MSQRPWDSLQQAFCLTNHIVPWRPPHISEIPEQGILLPRSSKMKKPNLRIHTSMAIHLPRMSIAKTPTPTHLVDSLTRPPRSPIGTYLGLVRTAHQRNSKLDRFFASDALRPRIDACTIRHAFDHGLAGCLSSKRVLPYFLLYVLKVSSKESVGLIAGKPI